MLHSTFVVGTSLYLSSRTLFCLAFRNNQEAMELLAYRGGGHCAMACHKFAADVIFRDYYVVRTKSGKLKIDSRWRPFFLEITMIWGEKWRNGRRNRSEDFFFRDHYDVRRKK